MTAFSGIDLRPVASTNGGELAGACPWCGGDDRFRVWPNSGDSGRYWCRSCDKSGDGIQFLIELQDMTYRQACEHLALEPRDRTRHFSFDRPKWRPAPTVYPPEAWQGMAAKITDRAQVLLHQDLETLRWLENERGLTTATIDAGKLGLIPKDCWFDRQSWGLEPGKKLWLPEGLLIPCRASPGSVVRLRIRRPEPGDGPRYIVATGGYPGPVGWDIDQHNILVVESELDGLLCWQEAPDDIGVIAMGSAQAKPSSGLHEILKGKSRLMIALDNDAAGEKAAAWWVKQYPTAVRLTPTEKDPGAMYQAGHDVRSWLITDEV